MDPDERDLSPADRELLERKPGRSFTDPDKPLGHALIQQASPHGGDPEEEVYGRAAEHFREGPGLPERAKCVAVLRKADELMAEDNPPGDTDANQRRALELACGRSGVKVEEYDRMVDDDEEVKALEAAVLDAAYRRWKLLREHRPEPEPVTARGA